MSTITISKGLLLSACLSVAGTVSAETPQLVDAAQRGDRAAALALIGTGTDVDAYAADGTRALHWAVRQNDLGLADVLLDAGADPSAANRYGVTPLQLAALNGSADLIERLLDAGAAADEVGVDGETVLMTAARSGSAAAVEILLDNSAVVDAREQWHGQTALMWAAAHGHADVIRRLIAHGADVNARSSIEEWERQWTAEPRAKWLPPGGMTPLLFAAREGRVAAMDVLIDSGADIDATTPDGISGAVLALINGHYDAAAAIIEAGGDPNLVDVSGRGALYAAVDFNTMPKSNRPAPHVLENEHSAFDIIGMLLAAGADPNAQLEQLAPYRAKLDRGNDTVLRKGTTPLLRAAKAADLDAMRLLLAHGADPTLTTDSGVNALMLAAGVGTTEQDTTGRDKTESQAIAAMELLLQQGLDINAVDSRGRTALHGAALQGYDEVVRALARLGAQLDIEDNDGFTPYDTAMGLAGGWGFSGKESVVQESTAALLQELMAAQ